MKPSARSRRAKWHDWRRWLIGFAVLCSALQGAPAPTPLSTEYQLKAVFLFNFAQFVEWPAKAFREPKSPLVIAILGEDPFGAYLDELVKGEKVGERPLVVRRYPHSEEVGECQIVFICRSESKEMEKILSSLKERSLLTVSDTDFFIHQGGMVRFATESGKIRLKINYEATKSCGLTVSSKIMRPGIIANPAKD